MQLPLLLSCKMPTLKKITVHHPLPRLHSLFLTIYPIIPTALAIIDVQTNTGHGRILITRQCFKPFQTNNNNTDRLINANHHPRKIPIHRCNAYLILRHISLFLKPCITAAIYDLIFALFGFCIILLSYSGFG